jgi:ferritin-like metal-binding protein YciE
MKEWKDLNDLLGHEIQVLFNAEQSIAGSFELLVKKASNAELKAAFQQHVNETKQHILRLQQAAKFLDVNADEEENNSIETLIAECENAVNKTSNPEVLDAALIAGVQKIEHYEICAYGNASYYAEELGFKEVADLLHKTLEEEKATNAKLNNIIREKINLKALLPST